jgi:hypothetical protein
MGEEERGEGILAVGRRGGKEAYIVEFVTSRIRI